MAIPYVPGDPLTCGQIRELDILAIEHVGIPGLVLMENAARTVAEFVYDALLNPLGARVLILCGPGNNGGDGFVVARQLANAGVSAVVALSTPRERVRGDAAINLRVLERLQMPLLDGFEPAGLAQARDEAVGADVVVDALLGSGAHGTPQDAVAELIRVANDAPRARRVAIDIPSGLDADRGTVADPCFRADATITFVAAKIGFSNPAAAKVLGRVLVADVGIPRKLIPGRENPNRGA